MVQTATTTSKLDRTVPSPRPISSVPSEGRTRRLSLNIPNPPIRTPAVPVPARQGSINRHRTSFSTSINSPDRRLSSLSLSLSSGRGVWSGKDTQERFTDADWLGTRLGDVGRDEVGDMVCGEEGMEKAVEVILIPQYMIGY